MNTTFGMRPCLITPSENSNILILLTGLNKQFRISYPIRLFANEQMGIVKQNLWKFRFIVLVLVVGSVEQDHYLVFIIKTVFVFIDLDYVCISEILNGYDNLSRECDCQVACRFEYFLAINFN